MDDKEIEKHADAFASQVSTSHRVHADMFIGRTCYTTVTAIVRAAFVAGAKTALALKEE